MVDSGTYSTPGLGGSIASRYLEAISCGGQDLSALTMGSSGSRWTPERPKTKSIHRKFLNDSSCGMTATTAALETSASWSSKETPSRSDAASRMSNSRLTSQTMSAETRFATSPAKKLGIEDECSSIDSSSSHQRNRPAHLSLQMDSSFGEASFDYESFSRASSPGVPSPSRIMQKARKHLADRRRQNATLTPNRNNEANMFACGPGTSFFPKTSPRTPTDQLKTNYAMPPSPHQARLTGTWKPSVNRERHIEKRPGFNWRQQCLGEEIADSVAGAPTEVITNRTRDLLNRTTLSLPKDPPQVRRWTPSANSNAGESQLMHSLMDDASTNEDSSARSSDRRHLRALFDGPSSSSISATQSTDTSKLDAHVEKQNLRQPHPKDYLSSADSSFDNGRESDPKHVTVSQGKSIFGGQDSHPIPNRSVTAQGSRSADSDGNTLTEEQTQQQPVSPVRFFMKDDPIPQPRTPQPASSGEVTSSVSTTDAFLVPGFTDGTCGATRFIRYNARQTPNAHEVFQRRYSDSSNTSTLSTSDKEHDEPFLPSRSPIQPLFSLDRLDFSDEAPSPIRKRSQSTFQGKQTIHVPVRSKSCTERVHTHGVLERIEERRQVGNSMKDDERYKNSEAAQRFAVKIEVSNPAITPDPIFCPTGSISSSPTLSSENGGTSRSSHEDYINVGRSTTTTLDRTDSTSTGVDDELQGMMEASKKYHEGMSSRASPNNNTSNRIGVKDGGSTAETKVTSAVKERTSIAAPKRRNSSVQQIIQAFNVQPQDQSNQSHDKVPTKGNLARTSRESLVMGARIAGMVNEEKKDETNYGHYDMDDAGSVRSLRERFEKPQSSRVNVFIYTRNNEHDDDDGSIRSLDEKFNKDDSRGRFIFDGFQQDVDDDDTCTGSVRSLREKYEKQFNKNSPPRHNENDDSFSVKSLREKIERYWAKDDFSDDNTDDEGSVRSLREKFEPPKKRESQAMVNNLRSVFEPKRPAVKLPMKSRIDTGKAAPRAPSIPQDIPRVVTPVSTTTSAPTSESVLQDSPHTFRDSTAHTSDHGKDGDSQGAQIDLSRASVDNSERLTPHAIAKLIQETNSEKSAKATDASMERDEEDTISTHSSRLREPAHTPFLSMRERLLKFSKEQPTPPVSVPAKKPTPPTMHERLNRWANRHQNRNRTLVESIGGNKSPVKEIEETKLSKQTSQTVKPSLGERSGFFSRTNEAVKARQMSTGQMERHDHSHDHNRKMAKSAIFRGGLVKKSAAEAFKPVIEEKHYTKPDLRVKSNDTDISDGVTLDPSIADVSLLSEPTIHRMEENRDTEHEPAAIPSPVKKSGILPLSESQVSSPLVPTESLPQAKIHDQKGSVPSRVKRDAALQFDTKGATSNAVKPSSPSTPKQEPHYEDKGWAMTKAHNAITVTSSPHDTGHDTSQVSKPSNDPGWSPIDSDDWIDFSPSHTKERQETETEKVTTDRSEWDPGNLPFAPHTRSLSNAFGSNKKFSTEPLQIPPRTLAISVAENPMTNNYRKPPSSVSQSSPAMSKNGVRENGNNATAFDKKPTSLSSSPSPFDEDYSTLMDARHKMLVSRQRSHQERKLARETARVTPRTEWPAEAPGLTMTDFDPMVTPFLDSSRRKTDVGGGVRSNFFSRTHPNSVTPSTPPVKQGYRSSQYNAHKSVSPKDDASRTKSSPRTEERHQAMQNYYDELGFSQSDTHSSSVFSRLSEFTGLSSDDSRQETLVARLQSVKAARIRRKTPTTQSQSSRSHISNDGSDDLDASETTIRTGKKTMNRAATTPPPRVLNDPPVVVSAREAFERYMATSGPPPPPPPTPPPAHRRPASYRMSTRPMTAASKPSEPREVQPFVHHFDSNPFHPVVEAIRPMPNGTTHLSTARRYAPTPPLSQPPPPPPRYPNTSHRYRPATKPIVKYSNGMAPDDELDRDSSSSSSSNFFREGLTLD